MKKLLLIALMAVAAISCKKEEAPKPATPKPCICEKQTWIKRSIDLPAAWMWNGGTEFYSNKCADNGLRVGGYSGNGFDIEYRIVCK